MRRDVDVRASARAAHANVLAHACVHVHVHAHAHAHVCAYVRLQRACLSSRSKHLNFCVASLCEVYVCGCEDAG